MIQTTEAKIADKETMVRAVKMLHMFVLGFLKQYLLASTQPRIEAK